MPYMYRAGDNYNRTYRAGDYYRGDIFGSIFKGITRAIGGFASGGIGGAIGALVGGGKHPNLPAPKAPPPGGLTQEQMLARGYGLPNFGPELPPPPGGMAGGGGGGEMIPTFAATTGPGKGYHLNRSTYETRGGGTSRWGGHGLQLHVKGTVPVRNRRMNVGNARALKRALRRAGGFARLAKRVMSFTHPRAGKTAHFKFHKRKR